MDPLSVPEWRQVLLILLLDTYVVDGLPDQLALENNKSWHLCHMIMEREFDLHAKMTLNYALRAHLCHQRPFEDGAF